MITHVITCPSMCGGDTRVAMHEHEIQSVLARLPEAERDQLFALLAEGPKVFQRLTGRRPHKSLLWRHARDGVHGVRLPTVTVGRTMMTTARWLVEHWAAVDEARRAGESHPSRGPSPSCFGGRRHRRSPGGTSRLSRVEARQP